MRIGGLQRVSLVDYPKKVAAVVFVGGCNFRCPYCYNRDLVLDSNKLPMVFEEDVLVYLKKRKGLIDGVVITGGEPTLQKDLLEFVSKVKFLPDCYTCSRDKTLLEQCFVKIDTNGSNPTVLQSMVKNGLVDYVALDIKAPLDHRYSKSIGLEKFDDSLILHSIRELTNSKVDFELRTTVVPGLHSKKDLLDLARQLSEIAPKAKWFLQNFQPKNCLDLEFEKIEPYDKMFLENLLEKLKVYVPNVELRG